MRSLQIQQTQSTFKGKGMRYKNVKETMHAQFNNVQEAYDQLKMRKQIEIEGTNYWGCVRCVHIHYMYNEKNLKGNQRSWNQLGMLAYIFGSAKIGKTSKLGTR